ncbi:hypothetical protein AC628_39885 [Bradyrhizobium sp. NAS96.2]|nr:hypothetical protein AC628_39885 [Bradyrhizobium sp. NAS96.2]
MVTQYSPRRADFLHGLEGQDDSCGWFSIQDVKHAVSSPAKAGDPVFQRQQCLSREAAAYWIARSNRAMTAEDGTGLAALYMLQANE